MSEDQRDPNATLSEELRERTKAMTRQAKALGSEGLSLAAEVLKAGSEAAGGALQKTSQQLGGAAKDAAEAIAGAGSSLFERFQEGSRDTLDALRHVSNDVTTKLLPEARVRAFLLPTGSGAGDVFCAIDFQEVTEGLAGGWIRRPALEIWAARVDVDRQAMAAVLKTEFTRGLRDERRASRSSAEKKFLPELERRKLEMEKTGGMVEKATFGLTSSLLLLLAVSNPVFDLVFLLLAVFSGAGGVTKSLKYLQLSTRLESGERDWRREQEELEGQLDVKNAEFKKAIENLEVKVHPVLERILVSFAELDGEIHVPSGRHDPEAPPVGRYLEGSRYREAVPEMVHPLIDVEMT